MYVVVISEQFELCGLLFVLEHMLFKKKKPGAEGFFWDGTQSFLSYNRTADGFL